MNFVIAVSKIFFYKLYIPNQFFLRQEICKILLLRLIYSPTVKIRKRLAFGNSDYTDNPDNHKLDAIIRVIPAPSVCP